MAVLQSTLISCTIWLLSDILYDMFAEPVSDHSQAGGEGEKSGGEEAEKTAADPAADAPAADASADSGEEKSAEPAG